MVQSLPVNGQQPGFYLKAGMHWIKLNNYGRADWSIADPELATRIETCEIAQALQSLFNNRDRGLRTLELVEVIEDFCICDDDKECQACGLKLAELRSGGR